MFEALTVNFSNTPQGNQCFTALPFSALAPKSESIYNSETPPGRGRHYDVRLIEVSLSSFMKWLFYSCLPSLNAYCFTGLTWQMLLLSGRTYSFKCVEFNWFHVPLIQKHYVKCFLHESISWIKLACFVQQQKNGGLRIIEYTLGSYPYFLSQTTYVPPTAGCATFYYCFHSSKRIQTYQVMGFSLALWTSLYY